MRVASCLSVFALLCAFASCATYENHQVLRVSVETETQMTNLKSFVERTEGVSFWTEKFFVPGSVDVQCSPSAVDSLFKIFSDNEVSYKMLHEDLQQAIDNLFTQNEIIQAADDSSFFDSYANFDQMQSFLSDLQASYSDMSSLVNIGTTIEGRPITGIVISSGKNESATKIVINGCQHAREWISPMTVAYVAQYLLQNYTVDPNVTELVDSFVWTIIPIVNGDGYVYTWTDDRMWRKNRRQNEGSICYGVDINRNWDFEWSADGSSSIACADTYAGPSGFSEPEETALADYIAKIDDVVAYIDFHAYGELFMYPWGYVCDTPTADAQTQSIGAQRYAEAVKSVNGLSFTTGPICDTIYPASGDSADWVYGDGDVVYSYACELRGDSFILPASEIIPSGQETFAGIVAWASYIDQKVNQ